MEPHKNAKLEAKRERLISVLSLVDQMVDRILFGPWQQEEVRSVMSRAGKSGWAVMPIGFFDALEFFKDHGLLATDCSAFDWTFPSWIPQLVLDCKIEQTPLASAPFRRAALNRFREVLGPQCMVRLPDGTRLLQTKWGIMKSGWLLTISLNSDAQDLITCLAWDRAYGGTCPKLWAMGDDVLMRFPATLDSAPLERELRRAGILSKFASRAFEFAGFRMGRRNGEPFVDPLYPDKHKFLLAHTPEDQLEEVLTAYGLIYSLATPEAKAWLEPYLQRYARWPQSTYRAWAYGLLQGAQLAQSGEAGGHFSLG